MYKRGYDAFQQDWLQLGLLISWVINPGNNYHSEERLKQEFDPFVGALIQGIYIAHQELMSCPKGASTTAWNDI